MVASVVLVSAVVVAFLAVRKRPPLAYDASDVAVIWLDPVPEGPESPKFVREPVKGEMPLSDIGDAIPSPLPQDVWQGFTCTIGGDVVVRLRNGDELRYGPCKRPASIERLREEVLAALER